MPLVLESTKVPGLHGEQDALPLPAVRPLVQVLHVVASALAAKVFAQHSRHSLCPLSLLALPGIHGRHDAELLSG